MRLSLCISVLLAGIFLSPPSISRAYAQPPKSWTAYRIARTQSEGKPPEVRIRIWSSYLEEYPDSPYRERVLYEIDAATKELWSGESELSAEEDISFLEEAAAALDGESVAPPAPSSPAKSPEKPAELRLQETPSQDVTLPQKRPFTAGFLSLASTFGGVALGRILLERAQSEGDQAGVFFGSLVLGAASIVGPSMGHIYAGEKERARRWSTARLLVGGATGAIFLMGLQGSLDEEAAASLATVGGITFAGLVAIDLVDSFFVVQRKQKENTRKPWVRLAPTVSALPNGHSQAGLQLVGGF